MLIELRGTEFNRRTNLFRGLGRFNRGLALIGFRTTVASSRRSVSQGAVQKTAREKIKKARRQEARERLWENLTKGRSGIPGSGIPSDWSVLTDFVNTRALLTQLRYTIWRRSETFQRVTRCSNVF